MRTSKISNRQYYKANSNDKKLRNSYGYNDLKNEEQMNKINNILLKQNSPKKTIGQQYPIINRKKIIYKPVTISQKYLNRRYDNVINLPFQNVNQSNLFNLKCLFPLTKTNPNFFQHRELLINTRKLHPLQILSNNYLPINNLTANYNYSYKVYKKPKNIKSNNSTNNTVSSESKKANNSSSHSISKEINRLKELKVKYGNIYKTKSHLRNRSALTKPTSYFKYFINLQPLQIKKNINLTIHSNSTSKKKNVYKPKHRLPSINLSKDFDTNISNGYDNNSSSNHKNSISHKRFYEDIADKMIYEKNIINYRTKIKKVVYEVFNVKNIITPDKRIFIDIKYISLYSKDNQNMYNHFHKRRIGPEEHCTSFINKKFRICGKTRIYLPAMIQTIDIKNLLTKLKQYKRANQLKVRLSIINEEKYKYNSEDIKNGILSLEKFIKRKKFNLMISIYKSKNKKTKIKYKMRDKKLNLVKNNINNERYFLFSILDIDSFENIATYSKYIKKKNRMIEDLIFLFRCRLIKNYLNK